VGLSLETVHRRGWTLAATSTECLSAADQVDALVS
jgi:hypothetical protein